MGLTGAEAVAYAMKQINPEVVAAYPITPQTEIMDVYAKYVADGEVDTEFIRVESEHSAMSATCGASAAGVRAMTATSSQGLALMHEIVYIASGMRLPIVMAVVNRALSAPINIHCDHSDTMAERDSGWLQFYCESAQEAYDLMFIALKLAENDKVRLPVMVCQDGFITSHGVENITLIDNVKIKGFIRNYKPKYSLLDIEHPISVGTVYFPDYYFEHKRQQIEAINQAKLLFPKIAKDFEKISGVNYGFVEEYKLNDSDYVIVAMSSTCGTVKDVVDKLREKGKKVGLLKVRVFRPFPYEDIVKLLKDKKKIAILDRAIAPGSFAPLFSDIRAAFYETVKKPEIFSYIYGLGGRDINLNDIEKIFNDLINSKAKKENYVGLRE